MTMGYAITGSFCTVRKSLEVLRQLSEEYDIVPICSQNVATMDTRFIKAEETVRRMEEITGNKAITTIQDAEPVGPKRMLDILVVAPCTGNTLAKTALGITDTSVTMAIKAQLRNNRPVVIGVSTNDGLSASAKNIGVLLERKNVYFVPFGQDDCVKKSTSLVAHFDKIKDTVKEAMEGRQIQPLLMEY